MKSPYELVSPILLREFIVETSYSAYLSSLCCVLLTWLVCNYVSNIIVKKRKFQKKCQEDYDITFDISSLRKLSEEGWPIEFPSAIAENHLARKWITENNWPDGKVIAVLGLFDKGKTFLLNKIFGLELASGKMECTKALSLKWTSSRLGSTTKDCIIIDTAGIHSPLEYNKKDDQEQIVDKKSTEMFTQDLVFELTDFVIVIVNDLTWPDQEYLETLRHKLQSRIRNAELSHGANKPSNQIIVIHNFKNTENIEEAKHLWRTQVTSRYPGRMDEANGFFYNPASDAASCEMRHIYVCKDGSPAGNLHNEKAFEVIRMWVSHLVGGGHPFNPIENVRDVSNKMLINYLATTDSIKSDYKQGTTPFAGFLQYTTTTKPKLRAQIAYGPCGVFLSSYTPIIDRAFPDENTQVIMIDLPGLTEVRTIDQYEKTRDALFVEYSEGGFELRIRAKRSPDPQLNESTMLRARPYGEFTRVLSFLGNGIEDTRFKLASERAWVYEGGVLTITLKKSKGFELGSNSSSIMRKNNLSSSTITNDMNSLLLSSTNSPVVGKGSSILDQTHLMTGVSSLGGPNQQSDSSSCSSSSSSHPKIHQSQMRQNLAASYPTPFLNNSITSMSISNPLASSSMNP